VRTGFPLNEVFTRSIVLYKAVLDGRRNGLEPTLIDGEGIPLVRLTGLTEEG